MIIMVSGKSGSGKSSVARYLAKELDCFYVDLDEISSHIRDEYIDEIVSLVGSKKIVSEGRIDSKSLGKILFDNKELMDKYNLFIYEKQNEVLDRVLREERNVVIDSMFLPIMDIFKLGDYKILVTCEDDLRYQRIIERDNIPLEYLKKRDSFSLDYKPNEFNLVIDNNSSYVSQLNLFIRKIKGE